MPALDSFRRRLSLSERQLETLRRVSNQETTEDDAVAEAELSAAGLLIADSRIHPLVADLVVAMAQPLLELWIETAGPQGPTLSHVVVRGDEDLWYTDPWPADAEGAEVVYCKDELPQLPWILARLVGHRRAQVPSGARPVRTQLVKLAALMAAFSASDELGWEDVRTVAIARSDEILGELEQADRELWIALLGSLRGTWRITCAWGPEIGHSRGLAVWDAGPGGFWVRTEPAEPLTAEDITDDAVAVLEPAAGAAVWRSIIDLLPSKDELVAATGSPGVVGEKNVR